MTDHAARFRVKVGLVSRLGAGLRAGSVSLLLLLAASDFGCGGRAQDGGASAAGRAESGGASASDSGGISGRGSGGVSGRGSVAGGAGGFTGGSVAGGAGGSVASGAGGSVAGGAGGSAGQGGLPGGASSEGGAPLAGGAGEAGQGSGGSAGAPPWRAWLDPTQLEVRVNRGLAVSSLELGLAATDKPGSRLPRVMWEEDTRSRLRVLLDPLNSVELNPCRFVSLDQVTGELRFVVPRVYVDVGPELWVSLATNERGDVEPPVLAERVRELPQFVGSPFPCRQDYGLSFASARYRDMVAFLNVSPSVCALTEQGEVRCFSEKNQPAPAFPPGPFQELGLVDGGRLCARRFSGEVVCLLVSSSRDLDPGALPSASYLKLSQYGGCGVLVDGTLSCLASFGVAARELTNQYLTVAGSAAVGCAVRAADGTLECWGFDQDDSVRVEELDRSYAEVALGAGVVCARTQGGEVDCATHYTTQRLTLHGSNYTSVKGPWALCALEASGESTCIGGTRWNPPLSFAALLVGEWTQPSCAILLDGRLGCWDIGDVWLP